MDDKPSPKWLDKYDIVDPTHVGDLETHSAINEFQHKMPRHEAEAKAYQDYIKERTVDSAAHHLTGMKAAQGAGDMDSARRHGIMYQTALKKLGHPEIGEPPPEVKNKMKHDPDKIYRYKGHEADSLLAEPVEKSEERFTREDVKKILKEQLLKAIGNRAK